MGIIYFGISLPSDILTIMCAIMRSSLSVFYNLSLSLKKIIKSIRRWPRVRRRLFASFNAMFVKVFLT